MERSVIVVADDVPQFRDFIGFLLETWNYNVAMATNGDEVREYLDREPAATIIVDAFLPGMNALALMQYLHERGFESDVILMTASNSEQSIFDQLTKAPILQKPFTASQLREALRLVAPGA
jgi:CheY-like chemotaxis protein